MIIRCIAIDDEPLALDKIEGYVKQVPYLEFVGRFSSALSALPFIKEKKADLIFLDIQMDGLSGIQLLESVTDRPKVILTTAFDQYALKGYELDIADYLLKPISFNRFLKAVEKVYSQIDIIKKSTSGKSQDQETTTQSFVFVKSGSHLEKIEFNDIYYIEGMKDYLRIHTSSKKVMTLMSFSEIEKMLPSDNFIRVHKSYIIAINKIETIDRAHIKISGIQVPVGDSYRRAFKEILEQKGLMK